MDEAPATPGECPFGHLPLEAAQVAAYLLLRAGRPLATVELLHLLYLTERTFAERHGHLIHHDAYRALEQEPTPMACAAGIASETGHGAWRRHVDHRTGVVRPAVSLSVANLDRIGGAEREAADAVVGRWLAHGPATPADVGAWSLANLPEHREARVSARLGPSYDEITPGDMAREFGHPAPDEFADLDADLRGIADLLTRAGSSTGDG